MCAIAGILGLPYDEGIIQSMLSTMRRRGPDGNGVAMNGNCCLLHSRLAIVDPQGGQQPMKLSWRGRNYTLIYNGELYNTEELRRLLEALGHSFIGHSDTEVVLHAYVQWGEECLQKFNGIYAFAVWERERQTLFLARDRMGVKPLFYSLHLSGLLFASEIKTILCYPGFPRQLTGEGIGELILLGPGRTPGSGVLNRILELEPGCCARYEMGKLSVYRYWNLTDRVHGESFEETAEHVRWLVQDAICRQMTAADVPVGAFLSGGLDSSLIAAVCARHMQEGERLPTFSLDYRDNDRFFTPGKFQPNSDKDFIPYMVKAFKQEHRWSVLSPQQLADAMEEATCARDLPGMADIDSSLLCFCAEIAEHVKVALSGECADEIFGGYPWFRDPQISPEAGFPWSQNIHLRSRMLHSRWKQKTEEFVRSRYAQTLAEADVLPENTREERSVKQMAYLNYRWFMQTLLDRKDRMSMYHSLEVRVPFCDHRIAEYLYGVPWSFKDHRGTEKGLLRYAMKDHLPQEILWRKKSPYPKTHDPIYTQMMEQKLRYLLQQKDPPVLQLVERSELEALLTGELSCPWYGQLMQRPQTICYMLQLNFWLEHYHIDII